MPSNDDGNNMIIIQETRQRKNRKQFNRTAQLEGSIKSQSSYIMSQGRK